MNQKIYKILTTEQWEKALNEGVFDGAPVDKVDGYIHFSTRNQVQETAEKHFCGQTNLKLVSFDVNSFGDMLKWETSRGGDLFPHLYTTLDPKLALELHELGSDDNGIPVFPEAF